MTDSTTLATIPCCPDLAPDNACDVLDFHYRLTYPVRLADQAGKQVSTEVKLHFRLTRCPGPFALGNLLYTTTLLPGEKVKLFTSDRRTQFTYDSTSKVSYRNTQASEESFYMQQMSDSLLDTTARDSGNSSNQSHAHVDGHADAGVDITALGGSASMNGDFDADSASTFLAEHTSHAEASHNASEMGTRKAASVSVGEVQSRTHTESESEDHFESASREFSNPNRCHAVTFLFYQINKQQTVTYTLESVERRVILNSTDFTKVALNPLAPSNGVGRTSVRLLAADPQARMNALGFAATPEGSARAPTGSTPHLEPLAKAVRIAAHKQLDQELMQQGLLGADGKVSPAAQKRYSFTKTSSLPTPGVLVKGCLDDCSICEPNLDRAIELDLKRKELENSLLQRQIDLLDKSREYRTGVEVSSAPATP